LITLEGFPLKKHQIYISGLWLALTSLVYAQDPVPVESETVMTESNESVSEVAEAPGIQAGVDLYARDSYRIDTIICPFKDEIDYEPGEIECGLLQVPENREDPDSRYIELHFVKMTSRWDREHEESDGDYAEDEEDHGLPAGKRDDPVIYMTGGPGAKATYYVGRFKDHTLLDHRDLYILEQRGIGYSGDFCPLYGSRNPAEEDAKTFAENLEISFGDTSDCAINAKAAGVDLTGYNTIENARDFKAFRRALGFDQWNVWGISYGTIVGQAYIKEDPEGILAIVLDANMPLDIRASEEYWRVVHWYERDLQKLQEICQGQADCAKRYPDIPGRLREAIQSVVDNPIEVEVSDTEVFPSGKARFFQDIVAFLPFIFLYEQDSYPGLPGMIYAWADAVESRDPKFFAALAAAAGAGGFGGGSQGMYNAIICIDGDAEAQARAGKKDLEEYPILGAAIGSRDSYERRVVLCDELGMMRRPAEDYAAVQTDLPTLLIEGDMDPITPPPNAKAILPGFENATYVEFPFAGHGPSRSVECAGHMLNKFYDNPTAEPDLSCVEEMEEPLIWAPFYTTAIAPRIAGMMVEDKKSLLLPGAWFGLSTLVVLIAFLNLTFAPIGRRIDRRRACDTSGARFYTWLSATLSVVALCIFGAAFAATAEAAEMLLIFGLVPWASFGAWSGFFAGIIGLFALVRIVQAHMAKRLPFGTLLGLSLTGLAAVALSLFMLLWGLGPF
jgi:pimeloyl-ACP methyl ester carboxylesterase